MYGAGSSTLLTQASWPVLSKVTNSQNAVVANGVGIFGPPLRPSLPRDFGPALPTDFHWLQRFGPVATSRPSGKLNDRVQAVVPWGPVIAISNTNVFSIGVPSSVIPTLLVLRVARAFVICLLRLDLGLHPSIDAREFKDQIIVRS